MGRTRAAIAEAPPVTSGAINGEEWSADDTVATLREIAEDNDVELPAGARKAAIVSALAAASD